jgi:tetratricopeptide (TPR) repeat protein
MIAESVSKTASGAELGVDDTRFEEMMADIDDDEDVLATGRVQKRVSRCNLYPHFHQPTTDTDPDHQTREHRPTPEVARLLGEANVAYAVQGPAEALEIYLQVVRHDQLIAQAWTSLASCYEELGREEAARQMRFFAAHVDRDGDKWASLAADFK